LKPSPIRLSFLIARYRRIRSLALNTDFKGKITPSLALNSCVVNASLKSSYAPIFAIKNSLVSREYI
jgi:hypothetical protein